MTQSSYVVGGPRTGVRGPRSPRQGSAEPYDFKRPAKLAREHVRTLQIAYEAFARQFSTQLTTSLRAVSHVELASIGQQTYDEYIASLSSPTVVAMLTLEPLPGVSILEFSLSTAMVCIDHLLGGSGGPQPERPLTEIETPLLRSLLNRAINDLRYALESIVQVEAQLVGIEYNPQFAQANAPTDMVVVATFDMVVGSEECLATVCIPFNAIVPKLETDRGEVLSASDRLAKEIAHRQVISGLETAPVEVTVRFSSVRISPGELINLQPGDLIPLNHPTAMPLEVCTAGITMAHGVPGNKGRKLACLIVAPPPSAASGGRQ